MIQALVLSLWMAIPISTPMEAIAMVEAESSVVSTIEDSTTWNGTLEVGAARLRLRINITDNDGDLTGKLVSLDQNKATFELSKLKHNGRILSFAVAPIGARFKGKLSKDGSSAKGTFFQSGQEFPLTFTNESAVSTATTDSGPALDKETLEQLGGVVASYVEKDQAIGGELQVIQGGKSIYHQSYGLVHREDETKWVNNTLCNIRSMTKPITSAAAQILIDQGKLDLDAPVSKYLNSFDNEKSKGITVRQVLTHRSGLPLTVHTTSVDQYENLMAQVAAAAEGGPKFEPGNKFWYSDAGTDVVGALVAKVSGESLDQFVQREILEPLGMANTLYGIKGSDEQIQAAASGYMKTPNKWIRFWKPEKPLYPFAWGSQTVYSTTTDYAKFLRMLANDGKVGDRRVLSSQAVKRMLAPVSRAKMMGSDNDIPTGFSGLEVYYGQMMISYRESDDSKPVAIGHSGSDGTIAWAWPEHDLTILYFTQSRGGVTPLKLEDSIDRLIFHANSEASVPEHLKPYLGTFVANHSSFDAEEFTVTAKNGHLILDVPSQLAFELLDEDDQGYWAFAIAPKKIKASFDRNANNEVIGIKLYQGGNVFEVPRKGTARAKEMTQKKLAHKAAQKAKKANEKLQAAWVGTLDLGPMKPVMQFRVVKTADGKTAAYFDSVTEGQTGFDATWSIDDNQIKFDVAKIRLKYRGKLNKARDSAEGTWSQGGRSFPLTLKKQDEEYQQ